VAGDNPVASLLGDQSDAEQGREHQ
jgi:hypothetical protein